ncbi:MAG TPA: FtsX-like permease family protein [Dehalococcoidia bacterium]|nr:FtsX-like permease family protein [Dehalococcoidia bacterium]
MVDIARRNLFSDKGRLFISAGGVAFAVLLISILVGLYQGWSQAVTSFVRGAGADVWVRQYGTADMFHSTSFMPASTSDQIRLMPGVTQVTPFIGRTANLTIGDKQPMAYLVGYNAQERVGGPVRMLSGSGSPAPGQIVVDRSLAAANNVKIGQRVSVLGKSMEVVGISDGGNMMIYSFAFISRQDAQELLRMKDLANFFLLKVPDVSKRGEVVSAINRSIAGVDALSLEQFAEVNRGFIDGTFLPIILVLVFIGFGIGVAVIGLTIYAATMEKSREFGVLKALGATNGRLYRIVLEQALVAGVLGYVLGAILTLGVAAVAQRSSPMFVVNLTPPAMLGIAGLALLMSVAASYFPVNRLVRIDPAIVFRS